MPLVTTFVCSILEVGSGFFLCVIHILFILCYHFAFANRTGHYSGLDSVVLGGSRSGYAPPLLYHACHLNTDSGEGTSEHGSSVTAGMITKFSQTNFVTYIASSLCIWYDIFWFASAASGPSISSRTVEGDDERSFKLRVWWGECEIPRLPCFEPIQSTSHVTDTILPLFAPLTFSLKWSVWWRWRISPKRRLAKPQTRPPPRLRLMTIFPPYPRRNLPLVKCQYRSCYEPSFDQLFVRFKSSKRLSVFHWFCFFLCF